MDDLATRYADLLETVAARVRALTVDRVLRWTKLASLGLVAAVLAVTATVFLVVGVFRLVSLWLGNQGAYLAFGGLFLLGGTLLWSRRNPRRKDPTP